MSVLNGKIKKININSDREFSVDFEGRFLSGNLAVMDEIEQATILKEQGATKFEMFGADILNQDNGQAFIVVKITMKKSKDDSDVPVVKAKIKVKCPEHADLVTTTAQLIDSYSEECEIVAEWA